MPVAQIVRSAQQLGGGRDHIEAHRQAMPGMDAGRCAVERQFADGDAHAASPLVAKSQDPLVVGGHDQQQPAHEPSSRENGNAQGGALRGPPDQEGADVALHGEMDAEVDLRQGAGDDEDHEQSQARQGELQRAQRVDGPAQGVISPHRARAP